MSNYDRFWDLHVLARDGHYDFASQIREQAEHQAAKQTADSLKRFLLSPVDSKHKCIITPDELAAVDDLPDGYVASAISISDLETGAVSVTAQNLVRWINDPGRTGKLRVNAHGDGEGAIWMSEQTGVTSSVAADLLITWLTRNGLSPVANNARVKSVAGNKNSKGLVTIALAACMGARYMTTGATLGSASSTAAPSSAVALMVSALRQAGITGVEVTGSNEIVMSVDGRLYRDTQPAPQTRGAADKAWEEGQQDGTRLWTIEIPAGWDVRSFLFSRGGVINIPMDYAIKGVAHNRGRHPSGGWILTHHGDGSTVDVSEGWIVDEARRTISPPLGWHVKSHGRGRGGTLIATSPGHAEPLAHSPFKIREIS